MIPRKRPLDLVTAFELVETGAVLIIVGDGPLRPEIECRLRRRGVQDVRCVGFQTQADLPRYYAIADVFALPSEDEPWGLVVNEAMCFSLPVITTRGVAAAADLVVDGETGFVYDAGDVDALRKRLQQLLEDDGKRVHMGERGRALIQRWDQTAAVDGIARAVVLAHTRRR